MFRGINNRCVFFHAGCAHPMKANEHCESRSCPLLRDLRPPVEEYDQTYHLNDMLSELWKWDFRIVPGSQKVTFSDGAPRLPAISAVVKGPKRNEDRVRQELNRDVLNRY